MNGVQKNAAIQLFAITYMIACIIGLCLGESWGLVLALAMVAFFALALGGVIVYGIFDLVRTLIRGYE